MPRRLVPCAIAVICGCSAPVSPAARGAAPDTAGGRPLCRELGGGGAADRAACDKDWSVLIYMMADAPDLAPYALWNLRQMEGRLSGPAGEPASAASGRDADVVVELDVDWPPGIRRLHVVGGSAAFVPLHAIDPDAAPALESPVIEALDEPRAEAPPATPATRLSAFLAWGIAHYPARHYAVTVWGHGFGFRPAGTDGHWRDHEALRGGIAPDASDHTVLDTPALHDALAGVSRARLGGRPIDLYLSDACLMQTIEVGAELADTVRYIGGAEAKLTPLGLPYRLVVPLLNGGAPPPPSPRCASQDAACRFAAALPELVRRGVGPDSELYDAAEVAAAARDALTYSVVDARVLADRVVPAIHRLGAALLAYLREAPYQAARGAALRGVLEPHRATAVNPAHVYAFPGGGRDLGSLLVRLRAERARAAAPTTPAAAALEAAIDDAELALRGAVLASVLGSRYDGPEYAGMLGVSVWLPISADAYRQDGGWFAAARAYRAPDGTTGAASPWAAWLRELFENSTQGATQ